MTVARSARGRIQTLEALLWDLLLQVTELSPVKSHLNEFQARVLEHIFEKKQDPAEHLLKLPEEPSSFPVGLTPALVPTLI